VVELAPPIQQPEPVVQPTPPPAPALVWPVLGGSVSQFYHAGHLALDIAAPSGTPVVASAPGVVTYASWTNSGGGNVVSIDHGGGMQTVYNHLGGFTVGSGSYVGTGQVIGYVGCTGTCTGPHVHFEVIVGGVIVNPLRYV
jgi:murein DD-endopeptidase MepM/ murein hydrolase activator NlpD